MVRLGFFFGGGGFGVGGVWGVVRWVCGLGLVWDGHVVCDLLPGLGIGHFRVCSGEYII